MTQKQRKKYNKLSLETIEIINNLININGISEAITCDFLKECGCEKLIKPDIHINTIFKEEFGVDEEECPKNKFNKRVVEKFNELYKKYKQNNQKSPYYIDKILYLSSTGNFYNHGIIFTKMNRDNLLKIFEQTIKKY